MSGSRSVRAVAAFGYVLTEIGLWHARRWSALLALGLGISTLLVLGAFGVHVVLGGAFARRTLFATLFHSVTWCSLAFVSCRELGCRSAQSGVQGRVGR